MTHSGGVLKFGPDRWLDPRITILVHIRNECTMVRAAAGAGVAGRKELWGEPVREH